MSEPPRPAIISHRGLCRTRPRARRSGENTLAAFAAGIAALESLGFPASIEFDVRRARDGRLVVIHDRVRWPAADVPLLTDVLDVFSAVELHVEVKEPGIAGEVKRLLLDRELERRAIVSSFAWRELPRLAPEIRFALTSALPTRRVVRTAAASGAWAIHPDHRRTTRTLVEAAHAAGLRVNAWTVNTPRAYARMRRLGVDAVFSDNPYLLVE
jgi:glycerophosphoryl diester phosphodiesterase